MSQLRKTLDMIESSIALKESCFFKTWTSHESDDGIFSEEGIKFVLGVSKEQDALVGTSENLLEAKNIKFKQLDKMEKQTNETIDMLDTLNVVKSEHNNVNQKVQNSRRRISNLENEVKNLFPHLHLKICRP